MSGGAHKPPTLISVDWGTTSLRGFLLAGDGTVLEETRAERGILKTNGQPFADVLHEQIGPWLGRFSNGDQVPVLMSGMIGSQQGWLEAAYLRCPASPNDLGQNLASVETAGTSLAGCDVRIVPGMDISDFDDYGKLPDVMRGEEAQVFGVLIEAKINQGMFVLPGTHSKWVLVEDNELREFRTFMTGEIYAALLNSTILGRLAKCRDDDEEGFALGVQKAMHARQAGPGQLLNMVFTARSMVLHGELSEDAVSSYLSGMLIGAEILSGSDCSMNAADTLDDAAVLNIVGEAVLCQRYHLAAGLIGLKTRTVTENPVPVAHLEIAKLGGLVA